jgi:signal transduction histidine kinase
LSAKKKSRHNRGGLRALLIFSILFIILYLLLDRAGQITALQNKVSLWYPPAALILAVVLRLRLIGAVLAIVAGLIGFAISDDNLFSVGGILIYCIGSPLGVLFIRTVMRRNGYLDSRTMPRPKIVIALVLASVAYASWNSLLLMLISGVAPGGQTFSVSDKINWFMGDAVGATAVIGFVLQILFPLMMGDLRVSWQGIRGAFRQFLLFGCLSMLPMAGSFLPFGAAGFRVAFLAAVPIFYAALTRGFAITSMAIVCANIGFMLASRHAPVGDVMYLQTLALMINVGGMLTAAVTTNQLAMLKALRQTLVERDTLTAERASFERKLAESQRLDGLGRMAGGMAHEINNLLHPIKSFARSAATATEDKRLHYLGRINDCADSAHRIVSDMLLFARDAVQNPVSDLQAIEAQTAVEASLAIAADSLPRSIKLTSDVQLGTVTIRCDVGGLSQVMVNLVNNARDAMPDGGTILVAADIVIKHAEQAAQAQIEGGTYVSLRIKDDGHGMEETIARRVFEPFFTTKDMGRGTGLGLSVVFGIVQRWSGTIMVETDVGAGATFTILIPLASDV